MWKNYNMASQKEPVNAVQNVALEKYSHGRKFHACLCVAKNKTETFER